MKRLKQLLTENYRESDADGKFKDVDFDKSICIFVQIIIDTNKFIT